MATKTKTAPAVTIEKTKPTDAELFKLVTAHLRTNKGATGSAVIKALRAAGYSFSGKRVRVLVPSNGTAPKATTAKATPATKATAKAPVKTTTTKATAKKPSANPRQAANRLVTGMARRKAAEAEATKTEAPAGSDGRVPASVGQVGKNGARQAGRPGSRPVPVASPQPTAETTAQ